MEEIGIRWVIDNYNVFHRPADQWEIFDVRALEWETMLSVESERYQGVLVQSIHQRVRVDVHWGGVENDFVHLSKLLKKEAYPWANEDINLDRTALNDYSHLKVALSSCPTGLNMCQREFAVDEGLIEVKHKGLPSSMLRGLRSYDCVFSWYGLFAEAASALKLQ